MPDSRRIVFRGRHGEVSGVFELAADGSGTPQLLAQAANLDAPNSVSPDGRYLIGSRLSTSTSWDVVQAPLAGAGTSADRAREEPDPEVLVQTPAAEFGAMISPDGRYIAYQSNESGQFEVYVRPYPRTNDGRWQISVAGGGSPAWARTGRELLFFDAAGALMSAAVETMPAFMAGRPSKILDAQRYNSSFLSFDVAPDGRFLMLKDHVVNPNLVVVLNWHEEVKRLAPK
jgi:serine/threonine-protein kinase